MGRGAGAAGAQALTWRQVPRISLVSAHRATALTPQTLGLSGLVLVALVAAAYTYLSLSSMKTEVEVLTKDLDRFTGQVSQARDSLSEVESELGAVVQQIKELDGAGGADQPDDPCRPGQVPYQEAAGYHLHLHAAHHGYQAKPQMPEVGVG